MRWALKHSVRGLKYNLSVIVCVIYLSSENTEGVFSTFFITVRKNLSQFNLSLDWDIDPEKSRIQNVKIACDDLYSPKVVCTNHLIMFVLIVDE